MTPGILNLTIYQGSTFKKVIKLTTPSTGEPVNLTDVIVRMQVRQSIADTVVLLEFTATEQRATVTNAEAGEITLLLSAIKTAEITFVTGVYDLEIQFLDGTVYRILQGTIKVSPEVTR